MPNRTILLGPSSNPFSVSPTSVATHLSRQREESSSNAPAPCGCHSHKSSGRPSNFSSSVRSMARAALMFSMYCGFSIFKPSIYRHLPYYENEGKLYASYLWRRSSSVVCFFGGLHSRQKFLELGDIPSGIGARVRTGVRESCND